MLYANFNFNLMFLIVESVWLSIIILDSYHEGCYHLYNFVHGLYLSSLILFVTTFIDYWGGTSKDFIFRVSCLTFFIYFINLFFRVSTLSSFGLVLKMNQTDQCSVSTGPDFGNHMFFIFMVLNCIYFSINVILLISSVCTGIVYCCKNVEEKTTTKLRKELEETKKELEEAKSSRDDVPVMEIVKTED